MRFFYNGHLWYNKHELNGNLNLGVENLMLKRFFALLIVFTLLLTGCSINYKKLFIKDEETPLSNLSPNSLLFNGEDSYKKTEELISSAKKSLYIEQTIFSDDHLMNLIIQKATNGVEVRILLDQFETPNQTTLAQLKSRNISVQYYPARRGQTNEVKFLIADLNQALVYSFPWTAESFGAHNLSILLTGKSVWKLAGIFNSDWQFTTTLSLEIPKTSDLPEDNILLARNTNVKQQINEKISSSQRSIWAMVSQVTDQDTVQALIEAANKGRDVRIILDPDIMPGNWPETIKKLKASGIQIRSFKHPQNKPLRMNIGIFDGETFILSSSGWGYKSFVMNHELSITVPSPQATDELIKHFDTYWQSSTPVS
jgi:cardiolipin synthase A/B